MAKVKNIALMAHVDAGKTTLTERILFRAGVIRTLGSVDEGTARTDDLPVERQRGISVRAAFASFDWAGTTMNLIDTPGHTDFYSQVERAFWAADAVVVLVSATDGVQSGTETIVAQAREKGVPVLFFVNKCDRDTARIEETTAQIKEICAGAFALAAEGYETAAMADDDVMRAYLDGAAADREKIGAVLAGRMKTCAVSPVLYGSAASGEGVEELLDVICELAPAYDTKTPQADAAGIIFSVTHDKMFGRGAYIRLFAGRLSVRDTITIRGEEQKVSMIKKQINGRWADEKVLEAGDIALVYGLSQSRTGDVFGDESMLPPRVLTGLTVHALLTVQVSPEKEADNTALKAALEMLTAEDPALALVWDPFYGTMHIHVLGVVQIEILAALLAERFGLKTRFGEPAVIYKEALRHPAVGHDAYTMPKPCWAILTFKLTPAARGSGVSFRCTAPPKRLPYRYRKQVEMSLTPALRQGLYGWEVVDTDIELVDGEDHPVHTHPLDFTIATALALMDGLRKGGTVLLEPILDVKFTFDAALLGKIMSDIIRMRGQADAPVYHGSHVTVRARLPLAASLQYPVAFASLTSGRGIMTQKLLGYQECPLELGQICPRRGVDPSDRSKYILAARHALSGTIFDA